MPVVFALLFLYFLLLLFLSYSGLAILVYRDFFNYEFIYLEHHL